jgi:hypothetical protein
MMRKKNEIKNKLERAVTMFAFIRSWIAFLSLSLTDGLVRLASLTHSLIRCFK